MKRLLCAALAVLLMMSVASAAVKPDWCADYARVFPLDCEPKRYLVKAEGDECWTLLDADGGVLLERYVMVSDPDFREGLSIMFDPEDISLSGFMNTAGELVTGFDFHNGGWYCDHLFSEGLCCVQFASTGKYGCINADGEVVLAPEYKFLGSFSEGLVLYLSEEGDYGYLNAAGEEVVPAQFPYAGDFHEGRAWVRTEDHLYGYIDMDGELVVPAQYTDAGDFCEGLAHVEIADGHEGYIRTDGSFAIEPVYLTAWDFENGYAMVAQGSASAKEQEQGCFGDEGVRYGLIDVDGREILPCIYNGVENQRGVNLAPEQIVVTAWLDHAMHFFRFEDGRAVEIAGLETAAEIEYTEGIDLGPGEGERDALVFVVAEENPIDGVTMAQLKDIYSGEITDWAALGAPDLGRITAFQAITRSVEQQAFEAFMDDVWPMQPPQEYLENEYGDYISNCRFCALPGAIGFTLKSAWDAQSHDGMKFVSIDGVAPTVENIRSGAYACVVVP